MQSLLSRTDKWLGQIDLPLKVVHWIGAAVIGTAAVFTTTAVVMRAFFNKPIVGQVEVIEWAMIIATACTMAFTQVEKRHIALELVSGRLWPKGRVTLNIGILSLSIAVIALASWRVLAESIRLYQLDGRSATLGAPTFPLAIVLGLAFTMLAIVLIRDLNRVHIDGFRHKLGPMWLVVPLMLAILAAGLVLLVQQHPVSNLPMVGLFGLLILLLLIFLGMPVGFACLLVGALGVLYIRGLPAMLSVMSTSPIRDIGSYTWSAIPLFVLMGAFAASTGIAKDLYDAAYKWVGYLHGGLAISSTLACTVFGAVCGSEVAASVTIGRISLPEMKRYGYGTGLATACVTCAGGIAILIPPSIGFIIYGALTGQNIGVLFIAGIVPGLILATLISVYVWVRCRLNPELGPAGPKESWGVKMRALGLVWPALLLFLLVIGGIYAGIFTPTEAASIGSVGALVLGFAMRRWTRSNFLDAMLDVARLMGQVFTLLIGVFLFTYFVTTTQLPLELANFIVGIGLSPVATIIVLMVILVALGCIMPTMPMILLSIPIFYPVALAMGFDPIWFGVLYVIMLALGPLTPPYGFLCWVMAAQFDVPIMTLYRSVIPFCILYVVTAGIIIAFPQLTTWLPSVLKGG